MKNSLKTIKPTQVFFLVASIVGLGLAVAFYSIIREQKNLEIQLQQEVSSQLYFLKTHLFGSIDILRDHAMSMYRVREGQNYRVPGSLLYWAEVRVSNHPVLDIRRSVRNPNWKAGTGLDNAFFQSAIQSIQLAEVRKKGMALLRIRKDPQGLSEWLMLGFILPAENYSIQAIQGLILVLVDPNEVFGFFKKFREQSKYTDFRAYLLAEDGSVIAHTENAYVGTNFSQIGFFQQRALTSQPLNPGSFLRYTAIDLLPVFAVYDPIEKLPLSLVVERIVMKRSSSGVFQKVLGGIILLLGMGGIGLFYKKSKLWKKLSHSTFLDRTQNQVSPLQPKDVWVIQEVPREETVYLSSHLGETTEQEKIMAKVESQIVEAAFIQELKANAEAARSSHRARILLTQYESDVAHLTDPKKIASRLTRLAHELSESPALFFTYLKGIQSAVFQMSAGLEGTVFLDGVSFSVPPETLVFISESMAHSEVPSLAHYPPLVNLLTVKFRVSKFQAWPVTGSDSSHLFGILVVFQSETFQDSFSYVLRTTGLLYENSIFNS